jgi:hypothetical protein
MNWNGLPESLDDLYPEGTPLSAVPADFRGMPLKMWRRLKLIDSYRKWEASDAARKLEAFAAARAKRETAVLVAADEPQGALF